MKNVAIVEMPYGVTFEALPASLQAVLTSWGVVAVPSVMAGSEPKDGLCLILMTVNDTVTVADFQSLGLANISLVGLYTRQGEPVMPIVAEVYDKYILPDEVVDEEGNVLSTTPKPSRMQTHLFAGMPNTGTWKL